MSIHWITSSRKVDRWRPLESGAGSASLRREENRQPPREEVPLKAPPAQNDRNVQTEPSREPLSRFPWPNPYARPTIQLHRRSGFLFTRLRTAPMGFAGVELA